MYPRKTRIHLQLYKERSSEGIANFTFVTDKLVKVLVTKISVSDGGKTGSITRNYTKEEFSCRGTLLERTDVEGIEVPMSGQQIPKSTHSTGRQLVSLRQGRPMVDSIQLRPGQE